MKNMKPVKKRRFNPVRVVNPTGDNHLVPLKPNQDFLLLVSPFVDLQDMDYDSKFFDLAGTEQIRDGTQIFKFSQTYDLTQWCALGSVYLGEVVVVGKTIAASLCVVLSSEKTDVVTVINPQGTEIKAQPHQIIEVVLYDDAHPSKWRASTMPGDDGVEFVQTGYQSLPSDVDIHTLTERMRNTSEFIVFPRAFDEFSGREHHYWFELSEASKRTVSHWKTDTYVGGRIVFEPTCVIDGVDPNVMRVSLNVRGRNRKRLHNSRRSPEQDCYGADDCILLPIQGGFDNIEDRIPKFQSTYSPISSISTPVSGYLQPRKRTPSTTVVITPAARPLSTVVDLKEREIAETMDPLYIGTTAIDQTAVNMSLSPKNNGRHWSNHDCQY